MYVLRISLTAGFGKQLDRVVLGVNRQFIFFIIRNISMQLCILYSMSEARGELVPLGGRTHKLFI